MFDRPLEFLAKNEDDLDDRERALLKGLVATTARCRRRRARPSSHKFPAPYGVTGVCAGETEAVHEKTLERCFEQYMVPVEGQADVLVTGIPYIGPYNVHAFLNPLLVQRARARATSSTCTAARRS